jgi:hypothetical protein
VKQTRNILSVASLLATPPHSQKWFAPADSESCGRGLLYKAGRQASRHSVTVRLKVRMGKTSDLINFAHGLIVGARSAGSSISETSGLLGFQARQCLGFTENGETNKIHPFSGCPVGENDKNSPS